MKFYDKNKKQFVEFWDSLLSNMLRHTIILKMEKLINLLSKGCPVVVSILREKLIVY